MTEAKTPGQVLQESLRESAPAAFGRPVGDFATWEQTPQGLRDRLENAARDLIAAYVDGDAADAARACHDALWQALGAPHSSPWEILNEQETRGYRAAAQAAFAAHARRLSALASSLRDEARTIGDVVRAEERHDAANRIDGALHADFGAGGPGGGGD